MANSVIAVNPLYFDTTGATSAVSNAVWITGFVWDSGDSGIAGDNLVLHDASSGNVVFQATLGTAKDTVLFQPTSPLYEKGLYLTTMDNGVLLVYLK